MVVQIRPGELKGPDHLGACGHPYVLQRGRPDGAMVVVWALRSGELRGLRH